MADGFIQVPVDSTGKKVDTTELTVGATTVERQRIIIADNAVAAAVSVVQNTDPGTTDYGLTVRDVRGNATLPVRVDPTGTTSQPVTASSLPLPTGAAIASKQPALGTAGTASADVLTIQGIASMTAVKTDGSAVTQPVSGSVTANIGTSGSLALDATLIGGTQRTKVTDGTNNAGVKAASTAAIATDPALVVAISPNNTVGVTGTFFQATQPVSGSVTANIGTSGSLALDATLTGGTQKSKLVDTGGTNVASVSAAGALKVDNSAVTQPVSGTVALSNTGFSTTPATSGGLSISHLVTAASTNASNIKASAGQVFGWSIYNNAQYPIYVKFHNTAGTPTAGAGVVHTIGVQAGAPRDWTSDIGIAFATGIGISVVKDITDAGATAVALNDAVVEVYYK